jgi:hypothetical protein
MGSFFILLSKPECSAQGAKLFHDGLELARTVPGKAPAEVMGAQDFHSASFRRQDGSGSPIARDPTMGNWLMAIGTWFHRDGYASGQETRLLEEYRKSGARGLADNLEGFFIIAVFDARESALYLITDIVGSCHCFLHPVGDCIAISNSSLLLAGLSSGRLDPIACQEFLATGVIYEGRSLFHGVQKLAPASIYRFARGFLDSRQAYWQIANVSPDSLDLLQASRALWEALTESARRIQRRFPHLVCDLTGGYDSRALVAAFHGAGIRAPTVVTGPPASPDVVISRDLAAMASLPHLHLEKHREVTIQKIQRAIPLTDGEYDIIEYSGVQQIHETLSRQFRISINGSFGELARGYWWELLFPHTGEKRPLPICEVAARRYAVGAYDLSLFPKECRLDLVEHFANVMESTIQGVSDRPNTMQMDQVYLGMRMHRWQGRIASSTNRIWPCLSPFMFRSVLEIMLAAQTRARRGSLLIRQMLSESNPAWANAPLEDGTPCLPVTWKNFHRFAPRIGYYAKKALRRASRIAGRATNAHGGAAQESPRAQLWRQEEVRAILDPRVMRTSTLFETDALRLFLQRSQGGEFANDAQWNRLLTLECAARVLDGARKGVG